MDVDAVLFSVHDTGIGISERDQDLIFEEFRQVTHDLQRKVRGTGLGLPLCRRLASILGGEVSVTSTLGHGSSFYLLIPRVHPDAPVIETAAPQAEADPSIERRGLPVVVLATDGGRRAAIEAFLSEGACAPVPISETEIDDDWVRAVRPGLAIVDSEITERRGVRMD
jgi:hypothetical protein